VEHAEELGAVANWSVRRSGGGRPPWTARAAARNSGDATVGLGGHTEEQGLARVMAIGGCELIKLSRGRFGP
jgi:hypothetical protein